MNIENYKGNPKMEVLTADVRHSFWPYIEGVSERTYSGKELESMKPENRPKIEFEGKKYDDYQATQMQRRVEREIRKQKRLKTAYESAGLTDDAAAARTRLRALNKKYREFSKKAGLPEQRERMKVEYPWQLTDIKKFAPLKDYRGDIKVVGQFSAKQYVVKLDSPTISGTTQHFSENLMNKPDRAGLTVEATQGIINSSKLVLYQPNNRTLKFLADEGYAVLNMQREIVTAVPEKMRKKYRDYLEGK